MEVRNAAHDAGTDGCPCFIPSMIDGHGFDLLFDLFSQLAGMVGVNTREQHNKLIPSVPGHIPAEILSKPTKLTDIEFFLIKEHSRSGYEMLKDVESPCPLAQIVYQHHERMDGSGYPRNLEGDEILMEARIMAVADVVEAMASHRPYRPGLGIDAALAEIEKNKGTHYDNTVADACLRLFREKGYQFK